MLSEKREPAEGRQTLRTWSHEGLFEVSEAIIKGKKSEKSGHLYNHSQSSRQKKDKLLKHCGTQRLPSAPSAPVFVFYCRVSVAMAVEPGVCV